MFSLKTGSSIIEAKNTKIISHMWGGRGSETDCMYFLIANYSPSRVTFTTSSIEVIGDATLVFSSRDSKKVEACLDMIVKKVSKGVKLVVAPTERDVCDYLDKKCKTLSTKSGNKRSQESSSVHDVRKIHSFQYVKNTTREADKIINTATLYSNLIYKINYSENGESFSTTVVASEVLKNIKSGKWIVKYSKVSDIQKDIDTATKQKKAQ